MREQYLRRSRLSKTDDLSENIKEVVCFPFVALCNKRTNVVNFSVNNEFVERLDEKTLNELTQLLEQLADKIHYLPINEQTYNLILNGFRQINQRLKSNNFYNTLLERNNDSNQ